MAPVVVWVLLSLGCEAATVTGPGWGELPEGPVDTPPPVVGETDPEEFFLTAVLPLLDARCNSCHTNIVTGPVFIDLADPYRSLLNSGVVTVGAPGASSLITKGAHAGPAWRAEEARILSDWIALEGGGRPGARPGDGGPVDPGEGDGEDPSPDPVVGDFETYPRAITDGNNTIDLDDVELPGASLRFFAQRVALGLHISSVTLHAGDEAAVITHPTFITHEPGGASLPDPEDRFSTVELVVPANGAALLADNVLFVDFPLDGELSVSFVSTSTL
jgi:hypothetical protein